MKKISDSDMYKLLLKIGLGFALMVGFGIYSNFDNLKWPFVDSKAYRQTSGQVVSSKIEAGGLYGGWRFHIVYEYDAGSQKFISDRVHFGYQAMEDRSYAEHYVERYPVGKRVLVFYDENNPQNSVLEPKVTWSGLLDFYLIISLLPIFIFGLAAYFYIKSRHS